MVDLNGFVDLEYLQPTLAGAGSAPATFRQHHANLLLMAYTSDATKVHMHLEFEDGATPLTGAPDDVGLRTVGAGKVVTEAAWAQWRPANALALRAGRFITPYGSLNTVHDTAPAFLAFEVPAAIYDPDDLGGVQAIPKLTTGVEAQLGSGPVSGRVWVSNGIVIDGNEARQDDNQNKGVGARLETDNTATLSGSLTAFHTKVGQEDDGPQASHASVVAHVRWQPQSWALLVEGAGTQRADVAQLGWTAQLASYHLDRLTPFVRAEQLVTRDGGSWRAGIIGSAVHLAPNHLMLKLEHQLGRTGSAPVQGELRAAVVGWF